MPDAVARLARIEYLAALSDEELCQQHPDTSRVDKPEMCTIPRWVNEKATDCPHEAWWILSNERHGKSVTRGCTTGTAEYLRARLWLDARAVARGMS